MTFNHRFWASYFRSEFLPQLRTMVDVLEQRLLPQFHNINEEAEKVSDEAWNAVMSSPGTGDEDLADFADDATQAGITHYMLLDGFRQGMVNLFALALYHAFEQQVMMFLRREVLGWGEEKDAELFKMSEFTKRLKAAGVDVEALPSWKTIGELRLVANTVKHAEGDSAHKLHKLRPDMFQHPQVDLGPLNAALRKRMPSVFQPLTGEGLYVSLRDVHQYRDALVGFWTELGEAMEQAAAAA